MRETRVQSLGREDLLEKEVATRSSTLAWKIPWAEEPGGLQSMGSNSQTRLSDFTFTFLTNVMTLHPWFWPSIRSNPLNPSVTPTVLSRDLI